MAEWWNQLGFMKQIFYTIAVPATIILVIQSILSIIGLTDLDADFDGISSGGAEGLDQMDMPDDLDLDTEFDTDAQDSFSGDFKFFTIRGMIAFFTVFGWTGAALTGYTGRIVTVFLALVSGALAMVLIGYMFYSMTKLQSSGNIQYINCIGKTGEVYLTIPPNKQGKGKVTLTVQERLIEVNAITNDEKPIKSGDSVIVMSMLSDHTVIVVRA
jgi:hypothetical protein